MKELPSQDTFRQERVHEVGLQLWNSLCNNQNSQGCFHNVPPCFIVPPIVDQLEKLVQVESLVEVGFPPAVVVLIARVQTEAIVERSHVLVPSPLHEIISKAIIGTDSLNHGSRENACPVVRETFVVLYALRHDPNPSVA
jgi:hypothetical protein